MALAAIGGQHVRRRRRDIVPVRRTCGLGHWHWLRRSVRRCWRTAVDDERVLQTGVHVRRLTRAARRRRPTLTRNRRITAGRHLTAVPDQRIALATRGLRRAPAPSRHAARLAPTPIVREPTTAGSPHE